MYKGMVRMKKIEKPDHIDGPKFDKPNEELAFLLWRAELNKELLAFWKSLIND
jgi:hypothetical protein